jgi:copper(I)-binding protein
MVKAFILLALIPLLSFSAPDILIKDPWVREVPPVSRMSAAFMTIINRGDATDRLIGVSSEISRKAEIHTMIHDKGMMKMRKIKEVTIRPGEEVTLKPGGLHIMLIGLKKPLREGERIIIKLHFEESGTITLEAPVRKMK